MVPITSGIPGSAMQDISRHGNYPLAVQEQVDEDQQPEKYAGPVMQIGNKSRWQDQFVQPGQPEQQREFEETGHKTDHECDTHGKIQKPFENFCIHLVITVSCSTIL